jgi:hypothetical protein
METYTQMRESRGCPGFKASNGETDQTQVKAGVKPELFRVFNIIKVLLDVNRM